MLKEEFRQQLEALRFQELMEKDPTKRAEIATQIQRVKSKYKKELAKERIQEKGGRTR